MVSLESRNILDLPFMCAGKDVVSTKEYFWIDTSWNSLKNILFRRLSLREPSILIMNWYVEILTLLLRFSDFVDWTPLWFCNRWLSKWSGRNFLIQAILNFFQIAYEVPIISASTLFFHIGRTAGLENFFSLFKNEKLSWSWYPNTISAVDIWQSL